MIISLECGRGQNKRGGRFCLRHSMIVYNTSSNLVGSHKREEHALAQMDTDVQL